MDLGRARETLHTDGTPRTREIHAESEREEETPNTDVLFNTRQSSADSRTDPKLHAPRNREDTVDETAGVSGR